MTFAAGDTVTFREVWADEVWLEFPALVVADDDVLDRDDRWWAAWDDWSPVEG